MFSFGLGSDKLDCFNAPMQENTPTPADNTEEEDTWSLNKIPVAWLGNTLAALAFSILIAQVLRDTQREQPYAAPLTDPRSTLTLSEDVRIDINTASRAQVESLPGIGEMLAREIIARRPFETVESLNDVPGIGPKRLARLLPLIKASPQPARP
jgi:hypothetical protein